MIKMELTKTINLAQSIEFDGELITCMLHEYDHVEYVNSALVDFIDELSKISDKKLVFEDVLLENYIKLFDYNHNISIINCDFTNFTGNLDNINRIDVYDDINSLNYILSHNFKNLLDLKLNNCGLEIFPEWLTKFTTLQILYLDFNSLSDIPDSFRELTNLKELYVRDNKFTKIPDVLQYMNLNLKCVIFSYNPITIIPDFVKNVKWRLLYLDYTQIEIIPTSLDHIYISCVCTPLFKKIEKYKGKNLKSDYNCRKFSNLLHVVNYTIAYLTIVHNVPLDVVSLVAKCTISERYNKKK